MDRDSFAGRLIGDKRAAREPDDSNSAATGERQPTAQSHNVTAIFKDGRKRRGFAMAHYSDYEWTEVEGGERLIVLFGNRSFGIEGELLDGIVSLVETGRLTHVRELTHREVEALKKDNPEGKPIVTRLWAVPELEEMLNLIKGEDEHETGHAGRVRGR